MNRQISSLSCTDQFPVHSQNIICILSWSSCAIPFIPHQPSHSVFPFSRFHRPTILCRPQNLCYPKCCCPSLPWSLPFWPRHPSRLLQTLPPAISFKHEPRYVFAKLKSKTQLRLRIVNTLHLGRHLQKHRRQFSNQSRKSRGKHPRRTSERRGNQDKLPA